MIQEKHHYDELADTLVIERKQDCAPIIKEIEKKRELHDGFADMCTQI